MFIDLICYILQYAFSLSIVFEMYPNLNLQFKVINFNYFYHTLLYNNWYHPINIHKLFFIYFPVTGHLGYFWSFTIMYIATVNTVCVSPCAHAWQLCLHVVLLGQRYALTIILKAFAFISYKVPWVMMLVFMDEYLSMWLREN